MDNYITRIRNFFQPPALAARPASLMEYATGVGILLILGIRLFYHLDQYMDIQFADEAAYMKFGMELFEKLNRDWGPVYTIWYKLLSYMTDDPIALYYLNYKIAAIMVPLLFYVFLLRLRITPLLALFISACFLYSNMNVTVWPRISNFCMILFLASVIAVTFQKKYLHQFITMLFCCLVCSYARPEFYLSFVATAGLLIIYLLLNRRSISKNDWIFLGLAIFGIALLHFVFRFPSNNFFGFNRGVAAFYQHYAYNYKVRTNAPGVAWLFWEELAKNTFGDCNSMWCVIKSQPVIFFKNTLYNIQHYIEFSWTYISSFFIPSFLAKTSKKAMLGAVLLTILLIGCLLKKERRAIIGAYIRQHVLLYIFLLVFCLPTLASCIVVYPRTHYILLQSGLTLTLLAIVLNSGLPGKKLPGWAMALLLPVFLLLPSGLKNYNFLLTEGEKKQNFCNTRIVETLRRDFTNKEYCLFTPMPFVTGMLSNNFREVNSVFDKKTDTAFAYYLENRKINLLLITPAIDKDPHLINDSTWIHFIKDPAAQGFVKKTVCGDSHYLLVKEN
jgi:hypothetical protein